MIFSIAIHSSNRNDLNQVIHNLFLLILINSQISIPPNEFRKSFVNSGKQRDTP